jgi:uncharacterized protein YdeI (YjbR/CyaY-like superfamily)
MAMITQIDDYFTLGCGRCDRFATPACSTRLWAAELARLRQICLDLGLAEAVKWGHPCYMHAGRNVAIIGALRDDLRLSFFHAALLSDPAGRLSRQGPNTQHPDCMRFTRAGQVADDEAQVRAFLREAMDHAEAGRTPPKVVRALELPDELIDALDADPELADAFAALTPGRQRSYAIALSSAKKPETRVARILKLRPHILAGKGAMER